MAVISTKINNFVTDRSISEEFHLAWIDAIQSDCVSKVQNILENVTEDTRRHLLQGRLPEWKPFPCGHASCKCYPDFVPSLARYTLHIALSSPSMNVLAFILQTRNVNIFQKHDVSSCNIFHLILYLAYLSKERQDVYISCYEWLSSNIDAISLQTLLKEEDSKGLNALELAAHLHLFRFFSVIFNTRDVYLIKEESRLSFSYKWYDVTDYEDPQSQRFHKSPLIMFVMIDQTELADPETQWLLSSPVIRRWYSQKYQVSQPMVTTLFLVGFLRNMLILSLSSHSIVRDGLFPDTLLDQISNNSLHYPNRARDHCFSLGLPLWLEMFIIICLLTLTGTFFLVTIAHWYKVRKIDKAIRQKPGHYTSPATNRVFLISIEVALNALVIMKITSALLGYASSLVIPVVLTDHIDACIAVCLILSFMDILKITSLSHLIILIQNMWMNVLEFFIAFFIAQVVFLIFFFMNLTSYGKDCKHGKPGFGGFVV